MAPLCRRCTYCVAWGASLSPPALLPALGKVILDLSRPYWYKVHFVGVIWVCRRTEWAKSATRCGFTTLGMKSKLSWYALMQRLIVTNHCTWSDAVLFFVSSVLRSGTNESEIVGLKCCTSLTWEVFAELNFSYSTAILIQANSMKGCGLLLLTCIWGNRANKTHTLISHRPRYGNTQEARKINSFHLEDRQEKSERLFLDG